MRSKVIEGIVLDLLRDKNNSYQERLPELSGLFDVSRRLNAAKSISREISGEATEWGMLVALANNKSGRDEVVAAGDLKERNANGQLRKIGAAGALRKAGALNGPRMWSTLMAAVGYEIPLVVDGKVVAKTALEQVLKLIRNKESSDAGSKSVSVIHSVAETLIEERLECWRKNLPRQLAHSEVVDDVSADEWMVVFRCYVLRSLVYWRVSELLTQSMLLHKQNGAIGARVLLRSAFETVAVLVYLNQCIEGVLNSNVDFLEFGGRVSRLIFGCRDGSTDLSAFNIVTVFDKCKKKYPSLIELYGSLSESSHPNNEGLCSCYSDFSYGSDLANFSSRAVDLYGSKYFEAILCCMDLFDFEFIEEWGDLIDGLNSFVVKGLRAG